MSSSFLTVIISILSALGTGFVSFVFTRAKYKSEVKSSDLANMAKQMEIYQKLHEDSMRNLDLKIQQNQSLGKQLEELREQNVDLKAQISDLKLQNQQLQKQISDMSEQIKVLQQLVDKRIDDFLAGI